MLWLLLLQKKRCENQPERGKKSHILPLLVQKKGGCQPTKDVPKKELHQTDAPKEDPPKMDPQTEKEDMEKEVIDENVVLSESESFLFGRDEPSASE
ncbi:hypothetical protein L2E82_39528 [Cichorium intybus]|uniref:Uncharacterized protein n=1 Tax=Cichorium intybus TaxID=13427 RepID=A0ACB9AHT0_CICIN|nr:hypothetical protein L2E82_39528 [Cichorium intybus]